MSGVTKPFSDLIGATKLAQCRSFTLYSLDQEVWPARDELDRCGRGDWDDVHVRRDHRVVHFGNARERLRLEDTTALPDIQLDNPSGRIDEAFGKLVFGDELFTGCNRDASVGHDTGYLADIF